MGKNILSPLLAAIGSFFKSLFGHISWTAPKWLNYLHLQATTKPKIFMTIALSLILSLLAITTGYHWYHTRPKAPQVIAQVTPPKLTPNDKILVPNPLNIDFGIVLNGELSPRAVAPLNLIGKEVSEGITITPAIPGKWSWDSDSHLTFTPAIDWPAGETYQINFTKDFFTRGTKIESRQISFKTLPFDAIITEFTFHQDPENPSLRQAVATINFSYPVDPISLEKHLILQYQALKNNQQSLSSQPIKYTINYDEHKRIAYVRSESINLPPVERYLELNILEGLKSINGPGVTKEDTKATVLIPDAGSYFKINNATAVIVRNQQDQPEQALIIESTIGTTTDALTKSLHAYVLPKNRPATAAEEEKQNYQWQDTGEITPEILASAQPLTLEAVPTEHDYATLHSYKFNVPDSGFIYIKIDKGTQAFGGFALTNDYHVILPAPPYPQEIAFLHKGAILALGTEEKLSVLVRGLGAVKFNFARVLPNDLNHLITQTAGDFSNPSFIDPNFNQDNISEIFSQIQSFDASNPSKAQYTALDLSKHVAHGPANLGLFILQARGWNSSTNTPLDAQTNRLVLITDMGLIVKDNQNGTHDVFVQSITSGVPVNNANVAVLGKNGLPILTHATDAQGHVSFPVLKDFTDEREPVVYVVHHGNDVSFIPYNRNDRRLNYSRFDIGGITSNGQNQAALTAYLFSDRGIYRPGDMAHIGMIVKQPFVLPQTAGVPLQVSIVDPRGVTVKDEKFTLNDSGYLSIDFESTPLSPTGQYQVNLYIVKDNHPDNLIGSMSFNVAEFLPDRMRISAHLSQEQAQGWISPTNLNAKIGLWNLYGTPAANHRVTARILLKPQAVTFKEFPEYTFVDPLLDPKVPHKVFSDTLPETKTNEQGEAEFDLKLDRFEKATYQLTVFTEGFEAEGGRSVATQTNALVSPLPYLVGYKADGDLSYIGQNAARSIHFIAINPTLQQQTLSNLKLTYFAQHPVTTLVKRNDGTYQYQSIIQTTQINSEPLNIAVQGTNIALPTKQIGDFLAIITDQSGAELSQFKFSIVGTSQQPLPKNAELNVKLNKAEFNAGEDIEMQITAPYTGAGLITLERDKVYAMQWFKTSTTASMQKIHIPADFQGSGYVNIAFVRDLSSPDIFMSPLSYSVIPFSVSHKNHDMQISLQVPTTAKPGEALPITYHTDKTGKIIVFAIDEGILQVSRYQTPDPLKFFFQKHALEVDTLQIVDQILPKFIADRELSAVGGDAGEAAINKNLNPFKRKSEAPVVYWSGILDTDTTSRQLTYQVPDYFNGSLRIMAVAVATDAVGATSQTTQVRGHFVINPNVPTFVAPGDEFDVTTSVANNIVGSGANAAINVQLTPTANLQIIGENKQFINVPEGQERSVHYKIRALNQLGSAELQFNANYQDKNSKMTASLSIRPAIPYYTSLTSGYTREAEKALKLDRNLYAAYRKVEAAVSPSPLILALGIQRYLDEYPYGCTEQLVSKAFPMLALAEQSWFASDAALAKDKVQQFIQSISQRQMSNGGFNYWPETGSTAGNDFASIYAMHFLTAARVQGYHVSNEIFSAGIGFLKDFAAQETTDMEQARLQAYAIYVLTRNEIVTTNYLTHLQLTLEKHPDYKWQQDITSIYIASTYQILKNTNEAMRILHAYKPQQHSAGSNDFYNQDIANAQYLYLIAHHFPEQAQKINPEFILGLVNTLNDNTISTVLSSYTSIALAAYGQYYPATSDAMLSIAEVGKDGKKSMLAATNNLYQHAAIAEQIQQVIFHNPAKQGYFYQLMQSGFDIDLPKKAQQTDIEVFREFRDTDNNVITQTTLGAEIEVHIRARATDDKDHDNIAIVDLLPGGFEVVRDSVNTQGMDYVDVREDRVIFFGSLTPESKEFIYRIKATNKGIYIIPPVFGIAMYNPLIKSLGTAGNMLVQ